MRVEPIWAAPGGCGKKKPGKGRGTQIRSPWDVLHPGRQSPEKLAESPATTEFFLQRIEDYLAGRPLAKLPKALAKQQAEQEAEAEDAADEI